MTRQKDQTVLLFDQLTEELTQELPLTSGPTCKQIVEHLAVKTLQNKKACLFDCLTATNNCKHCAVTTLHEQVSEVYEEHLTESLAALIPKVARQLDLYGTLYPNLIRHWLAELLEKIHENVRTDEHETVEWEQFTERTRHQAWILERRTALGYTLTSAAHAMGISHTYLRDIEDRKLRIEHQHPLIGMAFRNVFLIKPWGPFLDWSEVPNTSLPSDLHVPTEYLTI